MPQASFTPIELGWGMHAGDPDWVGSWEADHSLITFSSFAVDHQNLCPQTYFWNAKLK